MHDETEWLYKLGASDTGIDFYTYIDGKKKEGEKEEKKEEGKGQFREQRLRAKDIKSKKCLCMIDHYSDEFNACRNVTYMYWVWMMLPLFERMNCFNFESVNRCTKAMVIERLGDQGTVLWWIL